MMKKRTGMLGLPDRIPWVHSIPERCSQDWTYQHLKTAFKRCWKKRQLTDTDENTSENTVLWRRKLCYSRFCGFLRREWRALWYSNDTGIWSFSDWQEGFKPWHQSPQMSAMMILNFVKRDHPSSPLPWLCTIIHSLCVTSRWQSCYPNPVVWACVPAGWVLDRSGFNYV